jgi:hypothetical protein
MSAPVKEELIKLEISVEDDDMLVRDNGSPGLDNFFNLQSSRSIFKMCCSYHGSIKWTVTV